MAYEKFIKKDGKLYGPYIYHSKRVDGKVVSEYHGQRKIDYKKFLILGFGVLLISAFIYFFAFSDKNLTGNTILDLDANYKQNQPLEGRIKLSLQEGELVPASSKLVMENNGKNFEFNLRDLVSEQTSTGNFYVDGVLVSGSGEGYGLPGQKEVFPEVYFTLSILSSAPPSNESTETSQTTPEANPNTFPSDINQTQETSSAVQEEMNATAQETTSTETSVTPTTPAPTTTETPLNTQEAQEAQPATETQASAESSTPETTAATVPEAQAPTENAEAPITGNIIAGFFAGVSNFFLGLTPTGYAVAEIENEIQGHVSSGKNFTYTLQEGQRAEISPRSVKTDSTQLDDSEINLQINGNEVTVTTSYSEKESGFGSGYVGSGKKDIMIDISSLGIVLTPGDLNVHIVDQGQNLVSLTAYIKEEGVVSTSPIPAPIVEEPVIPLEKNLTILENVTANVSVAPLELTAEERAVLTKEFGNLSVEVKEATSKNGFIIVRYVIGDYWVENSYDEKLNNETLKTFMDADRTKWLKDIAESLSAKEIPEKNLTGFVGNYSV